jgi:site-specific recombinase
VLSPQPVREIVRLLAELVQVADEQRGIGSLFASHYSLLARKVAERSAESGEHYITRDRGEYRAMLRAAAGGGAVLAGTTFVKFLVLALGMTAFWGGFWAGVNYAISFVLVQLMHFTVATKQPAMTAPAMAQKLADVSTDEAVEGFVDEVAHLIRSQAAGIFGNLMVVAPIVLAVQLGCRAAFGAPLVGHADAVHVLESLTLLGPTALYAAFTGVLLFASSLIAGWAENWFVWHRLDSAIAWNPRFVARLGAARAQRWSAWWRANVSGLAANISLGLMLGLVPSVAAFFGLPIEVRHVTLSTGQLAAALGAEGSALFGHAAFWWCLAGIAVTGPLNLAVSFFLAFRVALRSRGIRLADRSRIYRAIRVRLWRRPASFIVPPR